MRNYYLLFVIFQEIARVRPNVRREHYVEQTYYIDGRALVTTDNTVNFA